MSGCEVTIPWVYPTIQEAIEREILPALGGYAEDFDVRAIADDVFEYVTPEDDRGRVRVDRAGFVLKVGVLEFWEVAFSHQLGVESWCDVFEAEGLSLPGRDGYVLTTYNGDRVRVACPMRTDDTYEEVDAAISEALNRHHEARGDVRLI